MGWRVKDEDQSFVVNFMVDGEFVIPDAGSVKLSLRDHTGLLLLNRVAMPDPSSTTQVVQITANYNTVNSGEYQARFGTLDFTYEGKPLQAKFQYNLCSFIPLQVTENDVRALFGAEYNELPDESIDLYRAYFDLVGEYGSSFSDALSSTESLHANQAVSCKAALNVMSSAQGRMLVRERNDTSEFQRGKLDFDRLRKDVEALMNSALSNISALSYDLSTYALFVVTTPTDAITGS